MSDVLISCLISGACTLIGTFLGIFTSAKLTSYRVSQLELKVEKHNNIVERTFVLEGQVREIQHEIRDMKGDQ